MNCLFVCIHAQTGANDLQTLADRLAQQSICASLSKRFPKITIIGEEVSVSVCVVLVQYNEVHGHPPQQDNSSVRRAKDRWWSCESLVHQELPAEEVREDLIENGYSEEILQRTCPAEYSGVKEEEVTCHLNQKYNERILPITHRKLYYLQSPKC